MQKRKRTREMRDRTQGERARCPTYHLPQAHENGIIPPPSVLLIIPQMTAIGVSISLAHLLLFTTSSSDVSRIWNVTVTSIVSCPLAASRRPASCHSTPLPKFPEAVLRRRVPLIIFTAVHQLKALSSSTYLIFTPDPSDTISAPSPPVTTLISHRNRATHQFPLRSKLTHPILSFKPSPTASFTILPIHQSIAGLKGGLSVSLCRRSISLCNVAGPR